MNTIFFHGTTTDRAQIINFEGLKVGQPWVDGNSYVWMTMCRIQAEHYAQTVAGMQAEITGGNYINYAVVEFELPIEDTEPDPEHVDKDTEFEYASHRRTKQAIPRTRINKIDIINNN